ncbi:probable 39S ribosomal protein L45, mitochondrial [Leptopilina heterotoma]|uniref:probable 39S ribosomal protein L45, mitochondrial n=1 Tax=Leptopilina heterotoma TaxID=63436 RepID=UPI001CA7DDA3|nr:probable 39S ribosomal protein L45, mitochondrial [Leptopilina heterotoma]
MAGLLTTRVSLIKAIQKTPTCFIAPTQVEIIRNRMGKHWVPKFKKQRYEKVIKVELPDRKRLNNSNDFTEEEQRSYMKKFGIKPYRTDFEKGIVMNCTSDIFEAYVPPEGDGKFSVASKTGFQQTATTIGKKTTSMLSIRKIRSYIEEFSQEAFAEEARDIYIKAHTALAEKDFDNLTDHVTEKAYMAMTHNIKNKQIRWKFIESLEPARLVRARHQGANDQMYAQVTVRFHTKQSLAVYDRFGRLMHGSEFVGKDVLEYIVFERFLTHTYGSWRLHAKIIPPWHPEREPIPTTVVKPVIEAKEEQLPVAKAKEIPQVPRLDGH